MSQYGKPEYWDARYTRDTDPFEWYQKYAGLKSVFQEAGLKASDKVLVLGAGNSRLSEDMWEDGTKNIVNVDISSVVVSAMQTKYASYEGMEYKVMDCTKMTEIPDNHFDKCIDKGTLDSLLCGENSVEIVKAALTEVSRVLKTEGVYFVVSYGQPNYRLSYLQREEYGWAVTVHTVSKPPLGIGGSVVHEEKDSVHFVYVCKKKNPEEAKE